MNAASPPPRTSWPGTGPLQPSQPARPRHAASEPGHIGDLGRTGEAARAGDVGPPASPASTAGPHPAASSGPTAGPHRTTGPSSTTGPHSIADPPIPTRGPSRAEARSAQLQPPRRDARLERIYVITGGRSAPAAGLDLVSLIVAADAAPPGLSPEQAAIMRLCRRPLTVAELSAHLRLPFSATAVLVADLLAGGLAVQRRPARAAGVDPEVLKQVINGLRRL